MCCVILWTYAAFNIVSFVWLLRPFNREPRFCQLGSLTVADAAKHSLRFLLWGDTWNLTPDTSVITVKLANGDLVRLIGTMLTCEHIRVKDTTASSVPSRSWTSRSLLTTCLFTQACIDSCANTATKASMWKSRLRNICFHIRKDTRCTSWHHVSRPYSRVCLWCVRV